VEEDNVGVYAYVIMYRSAVVDALGGFNTTYFDRPHHEVISVPHGARPVRNAVTLATHHLQTGYEITQTAVTA